MHFYVVAKNDLPVTWQEAYVSQLDALQAIKYNSINVVSIILYT